MRKQLERKKSKTTFCMSKKACPFLYSDTFLKIDYWTYKQTYKK